VSADITVRKTTISLSDGRELSYFDTGVSARRDEPDRRGLSPGRPESLLRYDPLQRTWVMYASHRQDRTYLPGAADCPLCPSTDIRATEIPARDYEVVVFENRFPALTESSGGLRPEDAAAGTTARPRSRSSTHFIDAPYLAAASISFFASAPGGPLVARPSGCGTSMPGSTTTAGEMLAALP